jgi:hypothetical protein
MRGGGVSAKNWALEYPSKTLPNQGEGKERTTRYVGSRFSFKRHFKTERSHGFSGLHRSTYVKNFKTTKMKCVQPLHLQYHATSWVFYRH